jgi:hypothetical protein
MSAIRISLGRRLRQKGHSPRAFTGGERAFADFTMTPRPGRFTLKA